VNDRADFYTCIAGRHLRPLWEVLDDLVPPQPRPFASAASKLSATDLQNP
jgi:gentisate 1,2-dioxygenase